MSHYFIAIELDDTVKMELSYLCKTNLPIFHFNKWVHEQDYHLTLAFLGQSSDIIVERTMESIEASLKEMHSFTLEVNHLNIFGPNRRPRIFWAGVKENPHLFNLQKIVHNQCELNGFTLDDRPFTPHITLGRQWNAAETFNQKILQTHQPAIKINVKKVTLFQTMIGQSPKYVMKHQVNLLE